MMHARHAKFVDGGGGRYRGVMRGVCAHVGARMCANMNAMRATSDGERVRAAGENAHFVSSLLVRLCLPLITDATVSRHGGARAAAERLVWRRSMCRKGGREARPMGKYTSVGAV